MRLRLVAGILTVAAAPLAAQGSSGLVSNVTATRGQEGETVLTITGRNPCRAVQIDYGDGTAPLTQVIRSLPGAVTHTYARTGVYQVRVTGIGDCAGEAVRTVRVGNAGLAQPRRVPDDNAGGSTPSRSWGTDRFNGLDRDRDGRLSRTEWPYGIEEFFRADRDRDGMLSATEFAASNPDDDGNRFESLDTNRSGQIERGEWQAGAQAFDWFDRDSNNLISRQELEAGDPTSRDAFVALDANRDQRLSLDEWVWSRRTFDQRDTNGDGALTRAELGAGSAPTLGASRGTQRRLVVVPGRQPWVDTGVTVQAGDRISFVASGTVRLSSDEADVADADGARSGRLAPEGPRPRDPAGALIARIGADTPVLIGARAEALQAPTSGRLYLGVNDDFHEDNSGGFKVEIVVTR